MKTKELLKALLDGKTIKREMIQTLNGIVPGEWYIV